MVSCRYKLSGEFFLCREMSVRLINRINKFQRLRTRSDFVRALAQVKKAAALANMSTGRLDSKIGKPLVQAADEIIDGKLLDQFPVDPIQGGAGTSINMNMNEVLCNRLEIIGQPKGSYDVISPNNHANMAQSTNDVLPTGIKVCISYKS